MARSSARQSIMPRPETSGSPRRLDAFEFAFDIPAFAERKPTMEMRRLTRLQVGELRIRMKAGAVLVGPQAVTTLPGGDDPGYQTIFSSQYLRSSSLLGRRTLSALPRGAPCGGISCLTESPASATIPNIVTRTFKAGANNSEWYLLLSVLLI